MARAPGWLDITHDRQRNVMHLRIRRWHPGFWIEIWRSLEVKPWIIKPLVWIVATIHLIRTMK